MSDTLEKALEERDRLARNYRAAKRAQFERAFAAEPRLRGFDREIRRCGIEDADLMISLCRAHHGIWLRNTSDETRALALEIVDRRIVQIRTKAGLAPIDDALPWEADDVFQTCRKILA